MISKEHQDRFNRSVDQVLRGDSDSTLIDNCVEVIAEERGTTDADRLFYHLKIGYGLHIISEASMLLMEGDKA